VAQIETLNMDLVLKKVLRKVWAGLSGVKEHERKAYEAISQCLGDCVEP
jgi:hypothetical protein